MFRIGSIVTPRPEFFTALNVMIMLGIDIKFLPNTPKPEDLHTVLKTDHSSTNGYLIGLDGVDAYKDGIKTLFVAKYWIEVMAAPTELELEGLARLCAQPAPKHKKIREYATEESFIL